MLIFKLFKQLFFILFTFIYFEDKKFIYEIAINETRYVRKNIPAKKNKSTVLVIVDLFYDR